MGASLLALAKSIYYIFTFYISYTCVECGKDVMPYFASSSSYSNTFLVSAFTISQIKLNNVIKYFIIKFVFVPLGDLEICPGTS